MGDIEQYLKKLDRELRSGLLSLVILLGIKQDPEARYGYQIIERLKRRSNGSLVMPEGTVYPILHSLEGYGLVTGEWKESKNGPPRKYYRITPEGEEALKGALPLWQNLVRSSEAVIRGFGGDHDGPA